MPRLPDAAAKPPVPSRPKPIVKPRTAPAASLFAQQSLSDEGKENNCQLVGLHSNYMQNEKEIKQSGDEMNNNGASSRNNSYSTGEEENHSAKEEEVIPIKERRPLPLPKQKRNVENFVSALDQSDMSYMREKLQVSLSLDQSNLFGSRDSKLDGLMDNSNCNSTTSGQNSDESKSKPSYDPNSPPPKPPRGIPYTGPSLLQHSFTFSQGDDVDAIKGGSLGRHQHRLPSRNKLSPLSVEEDGTHYDRPRALSDLDGRTDQSLVQARKPPRPPPQALKPKLLPSPIESSPQISLVPEHRKERAGEITQKLRIPSSVTPNDAESICLSKDLVDPPLGDIKEDYYTEVKTEMNVSQLGALPSTQSDAVSNSSSEDVVAELKDKVVLRNKPHLRNRKEVRQSAPVIPDMDKTGFASHLKDAWKSQSVKRMPENKQKPKLFNKQDILVESKELQSKLAEQKKRKGKIAIVESSTQEKTKFEDKTIDEDDPLFDFVVVVSLRPGGDNQAEPYVSFQFPPKIREMSEKDAQIASIPDFCFPDLEHENFCDSNELGTKRGFKSSETFSFVLTDLNGRRNFGYCRHILVKDKNSRGTVRSEVYCIVSPHGLFSLYSQILDEVERQRMYSSSAVYAFLKAVLSRPMPPPGSQLDVPFFSQSANKSTEKVTLVRGRDSAIHEHVDFYVLFDTLPLKMIFTIVSCLLLEKRVILAACQLGLGGPTPLTVASRQCVVHVNVETPGMQAVETTLTCQSRFELCLLSACCHGLIALLYPFSWLHTYIPVLPNKLCDMCCLPTPYLLGILSGCLPALDDLPLDEVVIVDLDSKKFIRADETGESNLFPKDIQDNIEKTLQPALKNAKRETPDKQDKDSKDRNAYITEVFVHAYIHMIGHFPDFLSKDTDSDDLIQKNNFCRAASTKEQKKFLKKFADTQAFNYLVKQKIDEEDIMTGLFEKRLLEWRKARRIDFTHVASKLRDLFPKFKS